MRDTHLLQESNGLYGYSITPGSHLKQIFQRLSADSAFPDRGSQKGNVSNHPGHRLIDIGCGKGYVHWHASRFGFEKVCGIDIDQNLINIANKNIKKLKLTNVEARQEDALAFSSYDDYNYFFFYNPFSIEIFKKVFDKIILSLQQNPRPVTIIYYHPTCSGYIDESGMFERTHDLYDKIKNYHTYIYENKVSS
jgi:SAM-dependent methyltransferase